MSKINYQKLLDEQIADWQSRSFVPKVLIHACCAPCSSYVLEYLSQYCHITLFYFNPNITSPEEYHFRASEARRLVDTLNQRLSFGNAPASPAFGDSSDSPQQSGATIYPITFIEGSYDPRVFTSAVRGLEHEPEGGRRCEVCFRLRLTEAARVAAEMQMDYFTTTLTISPLKNADLLNAIGSSLVPSPAASSPLASSPLAPSPLASSPAAPSPRWLPSDFKKRGGYLRSIQLSREYNLYRQNYCGCIYSKTQNNVQS